MRNILIFNDSLGFGGTESLLVNILNNLSDKQQCQVTLLLPAPNENDVLLTKISPKINITYIYQHTPSRRKKVIHENIMSFFPKTYLKLVKLNLNQFDLIVSFKDSIYSGIFAQSKTPKILWIHNLPVVREYEINSLKEFLPVELLKIRIKRLIKSYRKYETVVCVSHASMNRYIEIYNKGKYVKGQNLQVIYNAVDFSQIDRLAQAPCDLDKADPIFIMATRFSIEKRLDRVIKSAKKLKDEGYKFKIIILGDGLFFDDIKNQISALSLENECLLPGYTTNPFPYMKTADWLICSSEKESFSLVLLESIYLGTPVITTDCGGPTEISANGEYALLTDNSTLGVYSGMKKALDTPQIADQYTSKAKECLSRFDYDKWIEAVNKILGVI